MPTEKSLSNFERQQKVLLPNCFREFAILFAAGELCEYYRFHVPLGFKDDYDLATYDRSWHRPQCEEILSDHVSQDVLRQMLFFCESVGGEPYAWRTDEITSKTGHEYM